ncbi:ACT domain-containing protein [Lutimaribacter marinistellae]|uniref:ACT domain-containing protein n=1 Tax=Lutimaribacter marinistellae TaxID=1820329 RepID=A0ABV7TK05_9RHOB
MSVVRETAAMISGMNPDLRAGEFAFALWETGRPWPDGTFASVAEEEGMSLIVPLSHAPDKALPMRCITLRVNSALDGVGLTAAVSGALARADIPANMVAGLHHDHVFVPTEAADKALDILRNLQESGA